jgi:6-phosphogluconolactonase (cycloisomerase 2 family)
MANYILVGSYSNDVTTLVFDSTTNTLQVASSLTVGHHPSWIASHNAHPSLVWTGLEQSEGKVLALSYDKRGNCKVVSETSSAGSDPCFLWPSKHEVIIANVRSILLKPIYMVLTSVL